MTALERIKEIEESELERQRSRDLMTEIYKGGSPQTKLTALVIAHGSDLRAGDEVFLLKAFMLMRGIASEMSDYATGGNGDYGEIDRMLEERMKE